MQQRRHSDELNVGAGPGSYKRTQPTVVAIKLSAVMRT